MGRWQDPRGRWGGRALNDNHCDENDDDDVDGGSDGPWEGGKLPGVGPGGRGGKALNLPSPVTKCRFPKNKDRRGCQ